MRDPISILVMAITKSVAVPTSRGARENGYLYLRSALVARYGQPTAVAIRWLEQAPESVEAQNQLANALKSAGAQGDAELVALAHQILDAVEASQRTPAAATAAVEGSSTTRTSARIRKWLFLASIVTMLAVFAVVIGRYGQLGFQENADLFDILALGLLPGIVALLPIWLIVQRGKDGGRICWIVYSVLLFLLITVVSLGYIYQSSWTWTMPMNYHNTGHPPTLWDWLSVALLPFVVPIATALVGTDDPRSGGGDTLVMNTQEPGGAHQLNHLRRRGKVRTILSLSPALLCAILTMLIVQTAVVTPPQALATPTTLTPPSASPQPLQNTPAMQMVIVPATDEWTNLPKSRCRAGGISRFPLAAQSRSSVAARWSTRTVRLTPTQESAFCRVQTTMPPSLGASSASTQARLFLSVKAMTRSSTATAC